MTNNCKCNRMTCPDGTWSYESMVGSKCRVRSMHASNFINIQDANRICTIEDIYFQVSIDGKVITIIKLQEFPDVFFTWKDLEITSINNNEESE